MSKVPDTSPIWTQDIKLIFATWRREGACSSGAAGCPGVALLPGSAQDPLRGAVIKSKMRETTTIGKSTVRRVSRHSLALCSSSFLDTPSGAGDVLLLFGAVVCLRWVFVSCTSCYIYINTVMASKTTTCVHASARSAQSTKTVNTK